MLKLNIIAGHQDVNIDIRLNKNYLYNVEKAFEALRPLIGRQVKSISIVDDFAEIEIEFKE